MSTPSRRDRASRAWSAFHGRRGARLAWRALLVLVGLAVFAPFLADGRPYRATFRDLAGYEAARSMLAPIAADAERSGRPEDLAALVQRIDLLEGSLRAGADPSRREALARLREAARARAAGGVSSGGESSGGVSSGGSETLAEVARDTAAALSLGAGGVIDLEPRTVYPLFAGLGWLDGLGIGLWLSVAGFGLARRLAPRLSRTATACALVLASLALAAAFELPAKPSRAVDAGAWKARIASDATGDASFAPIPFGPAESDLGAALAAPGTRAPGTGGPGTRAAGNTGGLHWLGTDRLGRDLLARLLHAGRTSFAVAFLACALITLLGATLGLAAGALRGATDFLVLRAIELLQAFPTLLLLLGLVALLPTGLSRTPWAVPLAIGLVGWTHVARLARAEALRVSEEGYVRAAVAAGFPTRHVLLRHVLPNSLGPVWIAASFVLSAGLVLESSLSFLGLGVPPPAPSFGGLLADARATQAWWLALFPGLWLCASIVSIHAVGEGLRAALDPRGRAEP